MHEAGVFAAAIGCWEGGGVTDRGRCFGQYLSGWCLEYAIRCRLQAQQVDEFRSVWTVSDSTDSTELYAVVSFIVGGHLSVTVSCQLESTVTGSLYCFAETVAEPFG